MSLKGSWTAAPTHFQISFAFTQPQGNRPIFPGLTFILIMLGGLGFLALFIFRHWSFQIAAQGIGESMK